MTDRLDRLYQLLPAIYREKDAESGEPLRALLQVIAEQVGLIEADIDQLYENWFIETAEDWVVPYIGDLIGYRPVYAGRQIGSQALNQVLIPRREVANTIRYRRQKGSLALLELLANDAAGWPARAVEFYRLLSWTQSLNHLRPHQGRTVDLRKGERLEDLDGPFDRHAHTVDVRRINSQLSQGLYNLPSVGLYVWRLCDFPVTGGHANRATGTKAYRLDRRPNCYTFSILGDDIPLYTYPIPEPSPDWLAGELNVPAPIRRRSLAAHLDDYYGPGKSLCLYERTHLPRKTDASGRSMPVEAVVTPVTADRLVVANLTGWGYQPKEGQVVLDPELGRIVFPSRHNPDDLLVSYHYGFSAAMGGGEYPRSLPEWVPVSPPVIEASTVRAPESAVAHTYPSTAEDTRLVHYPVLQSPDPLATPLSDAIRQWQLDCEKHAVIEIMDSGAYPDSINISFNPKVAGQTLTLRSADRCRPTLRLLNRQANMSDDLNVSGGPGNRFALEGVLVTGRGVRIAGDLDRVAIRHSTLVPGWELDSEGIPSHETEPSLSLVDSNPVKKEDGAVGEVKPADDTSPGGDERRQDAVEQTGKPQAEKPADKPGPKEEPIPPLPGCKDEPALQTTHVRIESSILGSISIQRDAVQKEPLLLTIEDSILDATAADLDALSSQLPRRSYAHAVLTIRRSTVFGMTAVHAVELGENTIFYHPLYTARTQRGCLRFCYVHPDSRTPRRYNCQPDLKAAQEQLLTGSSTSNASVDHLIRPVFNETRYGRPTYAQLALSCPQEIRTGADDESEMGAFHNLYQPQREANLRARLQEFTPADVDAGILFAS